MDTTENFGFPYPQCDPPLTQDASDIAQVRDLAEAIDEAVGDFAQAIDDRLISPDACRMSITAGLVSTLADNTLFFDTSVYDNTTGSAMTDLTTGQIRIVTDGWYAIGAWIISTVASDVQTRIRYALNGDAVTNYCEPGGLVTAGQQNVNSQEVIFARAGDGLQVQTRNGAPGTSVTYTGHVWACLVAPNV